MGQAILESYSRIIESLAFTVMSRIEDVLHADSVAQNPSAGEQKRFPPKETSPVPPLEKFTSAKEEIEKLSSVETPTSMTLSDFMGWTLGEGESIDAKKETKEELPKDSDTKLSSKPPNIVTNTKKISYIERLENLGGSRSPTARH